MNYKYLKNFYNPTENVLDIINNYNKYNYTQSKVRDYVNLDRKRRMDYHFTYDQTEILDNDIFYKIKPLIIEYFNFDVSYRELYKIGHYSEKDKGFYNPHTDKQGGMEYRNVSMVICLSKKEDYEGGEFLLVSSCEIFKFDYGDVFLFRSELLHAVMPVIKGNRFVMISFMFDEIGNSLKKLESNYDRNKFLPFTNEIIEKNPKYIYPILPDSGPGNQVISIKECYVMGKILNRNLILPKLLTHMTIGQEFINFNDIYKINGIESVIDINDVKNDINNIYSFNQKYENILLKHQEYIKNDNELQIKSSNKYIFKNLNDFYSLLDIKDNIFCVKHLFNNVLFNNCPVNGAFDSSMNTDLLKFYIDICSKFDFSDYIKKLGDTYINHFFNDNYISIHLRYPDFLLKDNLKEYTNYDENMIYDSIVKLANQNNINLNNIFIATNNKYACENSKLRDFKFINSYNYENIPIKYISFIEQYICSKSKIFIMSKYNDYSNINKSHQRSTWSSFVQDYRLYLLKLDKDSNILLNDLIE